MYVAFGSKDFDTELRAFLQHLEEKGEFNHDEDIDQGMFILVAKLIGGVLSIHSLPASPSLVLVDLPDTAEHETGMRMVYPRDLHNPDDRMRVYPLDFVASCWQIMGDHSFGPSYRLVIMGDHENLERQTVYHRRLTPSELSTHFPQSEVAMRLIEEGQRVDKAQGKTDEDSTEEVLT